MFIVPLRYLKLKKIIINVVKTYIINNIYKLLQIIKHARKIAFNFHNLEQRTSSFIFSIKHDIKGDMYFVNSDLYGYI